MHLQQADLIRLHNKHIAVGAAAIAAAAAADDDAVPTVAAIVAAASGQSDMSDCNHSLPNSCSCTLSTRCKFLVIDQLAALAKAS